MTYLEIQKKLREKGGAHLGNVRGWIQRKFRNGEHVTWGSNDVLEGRQVTVRDIEEVAIIAATSALAEDCKPENRICIFCENKSSYPWIECSKKLDCIKKNIDRQCEEFKLKENTFILTL